MALKISACVIVKNEAKNICQWLRNMKKITDEIIVVDTGSEDETVSLVEKEGIKPYFFAWCNDFAAAKNYALQQAHGDWILFLDADEYFAEKSCAKVRPLLEKINAKKNILGVITLFLNFDADHHMRYMYTIWHCRIFRNRPDLHYVGAVHEYVPGMEKDKTYRTHDIEIHHTGYSTSIVRGKMQRNYDMLQARLEVENRRPATGELKYLAECCYGLERYDEADAYIDQLLREHKLSAERRLSIYETWCSIAVRAVRSREETLCRMEEAIKAYPREAAFSFMKGLYLYECQQYEMAEQILTAAIQLYFEEKDKPRTYEQVLHDTGKRWLVHAYRIMGIIHQDRNEFKQALSYFMQGLQENRYQDECLIRLVNILQESRIDVLDIIELLEGIYGREEAGFVADSLGPVTGDLYTFYAKRAGYSQHSPASYLAVNRPEAAALLLSQELEMLARLAAADSCVKGTVLDNAWQLLMPEVKKQTIGVFQKNSTNDEIEVWQRMLKERKDGKNT